MKTLRLFYVHLHTFLYLLRNYYCNTDFNHIYPQTKPCKWMWTCRQFLSAEECHASLCLCLRVSCFLAVCCVNDVLIIDLTAAEASCWVCVYSYFKLKLRCILCVCVCLFVPLPPSIGPQQGGGWFTGWVDGWVGGGRWSWWSHHSGICAAEVKPHTVAPHPVYHCRYPLSSSTQTLLLPPNFKFIFPPKFNFFFFFSFCWCCNLP